MSSSTSPAHRPALDGIRAIALIAMMAHHAGLIPGGYFTIDLFFVLSGYLITAALVAEKGGTGRINLRTFWDRRVRRLVPAMVVLIPIVIAVTAVLQERAWLYRISGDSLASFYYVYNWQMVAHGGEGIYAFPSALQHTWSISTEGQFYLLWPLLVLAVPVPKGATDVRTAFAKRLLVVSALGAFVSMALRSRFYEGYDTVARVYYSTDTHAYPFFWGAALACVFAAWGEVPRGLPRRVFEVAGSVALIGIVGSWLFMRQQLSWQYGFGDAWYLLFAVVLIAVCADRDRGPVAAILGWRPLAYLGLISYGMYLWHWPIYLWVNPDNLHRVLGWVGLAPSMTSLQSMESCAFKVPVAGHTGVGNYGCVSPMLLVKVVLTTGMALASYYLVEIPVRRRRFPTAWRAHFTLLGPLAMLVPLGAILGLNWLGGRLAGPGGTLAGRPLVTASLLWGTVAALGGLTWLVFQRRRHPALVLQGDRGTVEVAASLPDDARPLTPTDDTVADRDPPPPKERLDRRALLAIEAVGSAVLAAILLWPVTVHLNSRLAGVMDAPYSMWLGWRLGDGLRHGQLLLTSLPDALHPLGANLLLLDGALPSWVMALCNLVVGPIAAYNLTLAIGVVANYWAARALALELSPRRDVAIVAGVAFAVLPHLAGSLDAHVTFVWAFTLPLLVREGIRLGRGTGSAPRLALLLATAFACSAYHFLFGGAALVFIALAWPDSRARRGRGLATLAVGVGVATVALSPLVVARVNHERHERAAGATTTSYVDESVALSADGIGAIAPPEQLRLRPPVVPLFDLGDELFGRLRPAFAGFVLLGGLGVALAVRRRGTAALGVTALALWIASLGPALRFAGGWPVSGVDGKPLTILPWRLLMEVPGLGALRAPTRANYALGAVLVALLALALDQFLDHTPARRSRLGVLAAIGVALALTVVGPIDSSTIGLDPRTDAALRTVAERGAPDEALLVVPWGCRLDDPAIVALQTIHQQPVMGCDVSDAAIPWFSGLQPWASSRAMAALRCDPTMLGRRPTDWPADTRLDEQALDGLRGDLGVRFVLVDRSLAASPGCDSVRQALPLLLAREVLSDDGNWLLVDLGPRPR
jgi:peptidoglycan/LPS O-acetylase OafA/YrhL